MRLLFLVASSFDGPFEGAMAMPSRAANDLDSRTTHSIYLSLSPQNVLPDGTASGEKKRKGKFQTPLTGSCLFSVIWWGQTITKQECGIPSNCLGPSTCFLVQQTAVTEHTQPAWGTHRLLYWLDPDPSCMLFVSTSWICQSLKAKPMLLVHFLSSFPSQPPLPLIFWSKKNKKQMRVAQIS